MGCDMAWVILLPSVPVQQHIQNKRTGSAHNASIVKFVLLNSASLKSILIKKDLKQILPG